MTLIGRKACHNGRGYLAQARIAAAISWCAGGGPEPAVTAPAGCARGVRARLLALRGLPDGWVHWLHVEWPEDLSTRVGMVRCLVQMGASHKLFGQEALTDQRAF